MDYGVKETLCTRCQHAGVCKFKEDFLAFQEAADNLEIYPETDKNATEVVKLRNIPWISINLKCKYCSTYASITTTRQLDESTWTNPCGISISTATAYNCKEGTTNA